MGPEGARAAHPQHLPRVALPHTIDPRYLRELGPWVYESAAHAPSEKARRNA